MLQDIGYAILATVGFPLIIGYLYGLKRPHRPEYDAIGMWDGIGK